MSILAHEKQILEYEKTIAQLKEQNKDNALWSDEEIIKLESKLEQLRSKVYSQLTPWERVAISRHPGRPRSIDYIRNMCEEFVELSGDRLFRDDRAVVCGLVKIDGVKFMVVAQEKGCDTESRLERNFGMMHPEGYRKAMRCMRLAAKFKLPVLCRGAGTRVGNCTKSLGDGPSANSDYRHPHRRRVLRGSFRHGRR
jgi:acetyl-CoA carboxylase carboxyl transferase subunit alpha